MHRSMFVRMLLSGLSVVAAGADALAQAGACCAPDKSCVMVATAAECRPNRPAGDWFRPGETCGPGTCYPDIVTGAFPDAFHLGLAPTESGEDAHVFSFGITSCNVGTAEADWYYPTPRRPVISLDLFRLADGRLEQVGMSWLKMGFYAAGGTLCGNCPYITNGEQLGVGCSDTYDASLNSIQYALGPRLILNPSTGAFSYHEDSGPPYSGVAPRRMQVRPADLASPGALYFVQGQYFAADEAAAGNGHALNNASYRRVAFSEVLQPLLEGPTRREAPVIHAWRDHGLGIDTPDPGVRIEHADVPGDGRFYVGSKATDLGGGRWRYEYAVQNYNSDRAGGSFAVRLPWTVAPHSTGFHDIHYHSGDLVDPTDWVAAAAPGRAAWSVPALPAPNPQGLAANALRYATIYNFRFEADAPPNPAGSVTLGLHKPGSPALLRIGAVTPAFCPCDVTGGGVEVADIFAFLRLWFAQDPRADFDEGGDVQVADIFAFLRCWFAPPAGC